MDASKLNQRASRKVREGIVVSNKMDKTITVRVERTVTHPHFHKVDSCKEIICSR